VSDGEEEKGEKKDACKERRVKAETDPRETRSIAATGLMG
jgi:hypothetical protein